MTFIQKNWSWLATMCMVVMLGFYSCTEEDLCETIDCGPNGQCVNGDCLCDFGYSGANCEQFDPCGVEGICDAANTECFINDDGEAECRCVDGFFGANCDSTDPCTDIVCGDNGNCNEGNCDCNPGYEGADCETESRGKLTGAWVQTDNCDDGNQYVSDVTVLANDPINTARFDITNFGGLDANGITVYGVLSDSLRFTIPAQSVSGWNISSTTTGTYNSDLGTMAISYTVNGQECTAIFTRP